MKKILSILLCTALILSGCSSISKEEYETLKADNDRLLAEIAQHQKTIGEKDAEIIRLEALCDSMVTKSEYDSAIKEKSLLQTKYNTATSERDSYKSKYEAALANNATLKESLERYTGVFNSGSGSEQPSSVQDFEYVNNGKAIQINKYTGSGGNVIIPNIIDELPVTRIAADAFSDNTDITGVVLPDYLEYIGNHAFFGAVKLTGTVIIPEHVKIIEGHAFQRANITGLVIKSSCDIDINAFANMYNLEFIYVKDGCAPKIGTACFGYSNALKTAVFPASMQNIKDGTFDNCTQMTIYTPNGSYSQKYADRNFIWCNTEEYKDMDARFKELYD